MNKFNLLVVEKYLVHCTLYPLLEEQMIYQDIGTFKSKIDACITPYTMYELYTGNVFTKKISRHNSYLTKPDAI